MIDPLSVSLGRAPTPFASIAKSDTVNIIHLCMAIYVGTGGDVAAVSAVDDVAYLHKNVPDGGYIFGRFKRVNSTGTTAADMLALR